MVGLYETLQVSTLERDEKVTYGKNTIDLEKFTHNPFILLSFIRELQI